jgi:hypothetical protein
MLNDLINNTGYLFQEVPSETDGTTAYAWIHDEPEAHPSGVVVTHPEGSDNVLVWIEGNNLMAEVPISQLNTRLKLAIDYAHMADGLAAVIEEEKDIPNFYSAKQMTDALIAIEDYEASFSGSSEGISAWLSSGFLLEYDMTKNMFTFWKDGMNWHAKGADGVKLIHNRIQREVATWVKNRIPEHSAN